MKPASHHIADSFLPVAIASIFGSALKARTSKKFHCAFFLDARDSGFQAPSDELQQNTVLPAHHRVWVWMKSNQWPCAQVEKKKKRVEEPVTILGCAACTQILRCLGKTAAQPKDISCQIALLGCRKTWKKRCASYLLVVKWSWCSPAHGAWKVKEFQEARHWIVTHKICSHSVPAYSLRCTCRLKATQTWETNEKHKKICQNAPTRCRAIHTNLH